MARERLVLAADADRREIECALHDGTHQSLVALATTLQLARQAAKSDPTAVGALLDELERDVRQALDETARLAQRIYPSTLELNGLAALLRSVAAQAGVKATVDVAVAARYSPELAMTVYLCWLAVLGSAAYAVNIVDQPAYFTRTKISIDFQPRFRPYQFAVFCADIITNLRSASVLPDDSVVDRRAGFTVPDDGRLALVCDTDRCNVHSRKSGRI